MNEMKKRFTYIVGLIFIFCMLVSCDLEHIDNGYLDGYWHVTRIDTLATGGSCDKSCEHLHWAVQGRLIQLSGLENRIFMSFKQEEQTLKVYGPRFDDQSKGDPEVTDTSILEKYGITGLDETFVMEKLTNKQMILKGNRFRIKLLKQ